MQANEIRKAFLDFFQSKEHLVVPSSSLIPAGDPTLLLTSAGMVQFKPYFTGEMEPPHLRLASVQKCFRVSDIDEVGDTSHLTFFEMLGNFSVGDYFKREAIAWGWEFVTEYMKLPPEKLWATIFLDDEEAYGLWQEIGVPSERIRRFSEEDNYWGPAGKEGPCGPCSEIHYDFGGQCRMGKTETDCGPNCRCGRFLELWNLVFMQFYQDQDGKRTVLPNPNIDTGMGLERAAMILQDVGSLYDTDLFKPILRRVSVLAGKDYGQDEEADVALRVVAEHVRSASFLIADGVVPDNKGRGYVLRRLIRRAIRFGHKLELGLGEISSSVVPATGELGGFLAPVAEVVIEHIGGAYPELASGREFILRVLQLEEERFGRTVGTGLPLLEDLMRVVDDWEKVYQQFLDGPIRKWINDKNAILSSEEKLASFISITQGSLSLVEQYVKEELAKAVNGGTTSRIAVLEQACRYIERFPREPVGLRIDSDEDMEQALQAYTNKLMNLSKVLPSSEVFILHDTYGFPPELTGEIAREHGLEVDMEGFESEMGAQRERARGASGFSEDIGALRRYQGLGVGGTRFLGYGTTVAPSVIVGLLADGAQVETVSQGQVFEIVLRETPFYAEGGGQVGDTGCIEGPQGEIRVDDTQSPLMGLIVHRGRMERGSVTVGDAVMANVDPERRMDAARNHTATHLLHAALRHVLGTHVRQQGSLVVPERLRFDFTHVSAMSQSELQSVEELVNDRIRANVPVQKRETNFRQAVADGALAFFGDKYGDQVRVVEVANGPSADSTESRLSIKTRSSGQAFSFEVCGGTHVLATGDIGYCQIVGESSIGAGLRRIEAVTGRAAERLAWDQQALLLRISQKLDSSPQDLEAKVVSLVAEVVGLRREASAQHRVSSRQQAQELLGRARDVNGLNVASGIIQVASGDALREAGDWLRNKLGSGVVVLGAVVRERPMMLVMVTADLIEGGLHAGNAVKEAAKVMGGGGGGRPEMAQAGGRQPNKLGEALELAVKVVTRQAPDGDVA